jgi:hypothetical protein
MSIDDWVKTDWRGHLDNVFQPAIGTFMVGMSYGISFALFAGLVYFCLWLFGVV